MFFVETDPLWQPRLVVIQSATHVATRLYVAWHRYCI